MREIEDEFGRSEYFVYALMNGGAIVRGPLNDLERTPDQNSLACRSSHRQDPIHYENPCGLRSRAAPRHKEPLHRGSGCRHPGPRGYLYLFATHTTRSHRGRSRSCGGTVDLTSRIPQPQSDTAKRRQSGWWVNTAVPVGRGDFPGHASGKNTICSARKPCGIHEWNLPIGSADKFVTFTSHPLPLRSHKLECTLVVRRIIASTSQRRISGTYFRMPQSTFGARSRIAHSARTRKNHAL
jgi:hypothetical protein